MDHLHILQKLMSAVRIVTLAKNKKQDNVLLRGLDYHNKWMNESKTHSRLTY